MTMSKLLLVLTLVALPATAQDDPRQLLLDFLKDKCEAPVLMVPPSPLDTQLDELTLGCLERFGMVAPCLGMLIKIKNKDGSFQYKVRCGPTKGTEK